MQANNAPENWISSSLFVSRIVITLKEKVREHKNVQVSYRSSSGFCASSGIVLNSSRVSVLDPSESSFLKRRYKRRNSFSVTVREC